MGRGVAVRASTPLSDFLHDGLLRIDEHYPPALEPTLRDSCLRLPTCRSPAAIRCLPGVVIRSRSERSTMYPSPISRALCWAEITGGGSSIEHSPTVRSEANSSCVSTLRSETIDSSMARFPNYTCSILLKFAQKSRAPGACLRCGTRHRPGCAADWSKVDGGPIKRRSAGRPFRLIDRHRHYFPHAEEMSSALSEL
jgi:hypothetical protein